MIGDPHDGSPDTNYNSKFSGKSSFKSFYVYFFIFFICIMIQPRLAANAPYSFLSLLTPRTTVVCHTLGIDTLYKFQVTLLLLTFSLGDNKKKKIT